MSTPSKAFSTLSNISVSKYKSDKDATSSDAPFIAVAKPTVGPIIN